MSDLVPDFGKYASTIWICYGASIAILLLFAVQTFRRNARHK